MRIVKPATYLDMSIALNISRDRFEYINSYINRMTKDYQGDVIDIIKEIPLNLKGRERYFAMFLVGRSSSQPFSSLNDERKTDFIGDIIIALKIDHQVAMIITSDIQRKLSKDTKENISIIMEEVIDGDLTDIEKCYISFVLGLMYI